MLLYHRKLLPPCWAACVRFWRRRQSVDAK